MATWTSYDTVGLKEDVSDIITNISPTKTPFQSTIGSEKVTQKTFQWQEDSLRAVTANAAVEGFEATENAPVATVMRDNVTQILQESVKVSGTADVTSFYGRAKESAYQMAKSAAQVKRDLEHAFVGTAQTKVVGSSGVARQMASYQAQINTTGVSNVVYVALAADNLAEAQVLTMLQRLYDKGADPTTIMVTPNNSLIVADFAKSATGTNLARIRDVRGEQTIVNAVSLYVSPFGKHSVVLNRFLKVTGAVQNTLVFDPENWKKAVLRNWTRENLAKTGDSTKMLLVGEFSLKHKNFSASGVIVDHATTGF